MLDISSDDEEKVTEMQKVLSIANLNKLGDEYLKVIV